MREDVIQEELDTLDISVQGVLQVCTRCRDQETSKTHPLTPHFIVSVAQEPEVANLRSLQVLVERYIATKGPLQCKCCQRVSHTQCYWGYAPRLLHVVRLAPQGSAVSHSRSTEAVAAVEETTQATAGAVLSGRRPSNSVVQA